MKEEFIEVHWTSGSIDEARKISRHLVQERWVAHAQIVPWVESIYLLDGKLETTQQSKVVMLTLKTHWEKVRRHIAEASSYEIPEITCFAIQDVNGAYAQWALNP